MTPRHRLRRGRRRAHKPRPLLGYLTTLALVGLTIAGLWYTVWA
jgi:hypothetical protein